MPFTREELAMLEAFNSQPASTPEPQGSTLDILGRNTANFVPRFLSSLSDTVKAVADPYRQENLATQVPDFVTPPQVDNTYQQVLNTITGGVVPEVAAALVPFALTAGATGAASLPGVAGRVAPILAGNLVQGAVMGNRIGEDEASKQMLMNTALMVPGALPSILSRVGVAAPIAAADYFMQGGGSQGAIAAGSDIASVLFRTDLSAPAKPSVNTTAGVASQSPAIISPQGANLQMPTVDLAPVGSTRPSPDLPNDLLASLQNLRLKQPAAPGSLQFDPNAPFEIPTPVNGPGRNAVAEMQQALDIAGTQSARNAPGLPLQPSVIAPTRDLLTAGQLTEGERLAGTPTKLKTNQVSPEPPSVTAALSAPVDVQNAAQGIQTSGINDLFQSMVLAKQPKTPLASPSVIQPSLELQGAAKPSGMRLAQTPEATGAMSIDLASLQPPATSGLQLAETPAGISLDRLSRQDVARLENLDLAPEMRLGSPLSDIKNPLRQARAEGRIISSEQHAPIFVPRLDPTSLPKAGGPIIPGQPNPVARGQRGFSLSDLMDDDQRAAVKAQAQKLVESEKESARRGKPRTFKGYREEGGFAISEIFNTIASGGVGGLVGSMAGIEYADELGMDKAEAAALFGGMGILTGMGVMKLHKFNESKFLPGKGEIGAIFIGPNAKNWNKLKDKAQPMPETSDLTVPIHGSIAGGFKFDNLMVEAAKLEGLIDIPSDYRKLVYKLGNLANLQSSLLESYPQLKNVTVKLYSKPNSKVRGSVQVFDSKSGDALIKVNTASIFNAENADDAFIDTMTHEINHIVQSIENFPAGGSPEIFMDVVNESGKAFQLYLRTHGEIMSRLAGASETMPSVAQNLNKSLESVFQGEKAFIGMGLDEPTIKLKEDGSPMGSVSGPPKSPPASLNQSQKPPSFKSGLSTEAASTLTGAVAGAAIGYYKDEQFSSALAGAILGGTGGLLGSRFIANLQRIDPALGNPNESPITTAKKFGGQSYEGIRKVLNGSAKDLAGEDVTGRGGILPKVMRILEDQFRFRMPEELKTIITQSRGFASEVVDRAQRALTNTVRLDPPNEVKAVVNDFLDGKLVPEAEVRTFLFQNGAITKDTYNELKPSARKEYDLWTTQDDKKNVTEFYVKDNDALRNKFLDMQEGAFLRNIPEDWKGYGNQLIESRKAMNEFQQMFADGLPDSKLKEQIVDSVGRYVPRMYRIFNDPKYRPTDEQISKAVKEYGFNKKSEELTALTGAHKAYEIADYNERVASLQKRSDDSSANRLAELQDFEKFTHDGKEYMVRPTDVPVLNKFNNDDFVRREVEFYLKDLGANRDSMNNGRGLDKTMFMERDNISPAFRDMLGEYTDPVERMAMGVSKMYGPAQAARLISQSKDLDINGIKAGMTAEDWSAANVTAKDSGDVAKLQALNEMVKLPSDIQYGELSGLYVNRFLADYFRGDGKIWETAMGRHLADLNKFFKTTHIPLNPVTQVRQYISMPLFAWIGKATPAAINQALDAYRSVDSNTRKELLQQGIWTADFIRGELKGSIDQIMNGRYDGTVMRMGRKVVDNMLEAYRIPDMLIRGGAYLAAKNRISKELGKEITDPEVIQQAVAWTDRYTMNYDNIAKVVRNARNIPLVNPFISFQSEMLRITKNLLVDGLTKNPERLAPLATLAAVPFMAEAVGKSSLSKEDQKAWEKTKAMLPDYMRYQALVPTKKLPNGNFEYTSMSPILPHDSLSQAITATIKGDTEALATVNGYFSTQSSPLFNAINQLVSGENKDTGLKFRDSTETVSKIVSDFLPPLAPGGYEWNRIANVGVENLKTGRKQDWGDIAYRYSTGLSSGDLNPSATAKAAMGKLKRDISDLRAHYQRIANLQVPDNEKAAAYEDYRQGVELLIRDFDSRVNPGK